MGSVIKTTLTFLLAIYIYPSYAQANKNIENSDEAKILKNIKQFKYIDFDVRTLQIPKRKYDSPLFCDEMFQYKNGFIINSIASNRTGRQIDFTTNFYYYNLTDKSIKNISILKADTIESIACSQNILYYSIIKNGKRNIGCLKSNQYQSLTDNAPNEIHLQLDTSKWIKLGIEEDRLFILSPNSLFEVSNKKWKSLVNYSLDDFYTKTLKYRRSISMLPTKNIIVKHNSVYFLQEVVQDRTCNLLKLNITNGNIDDYFTTLGYSDSYLKQINDFTFLSDNSLLVSASRLIDNQMLINTKEDKIEVWGFGNNIISINGAKVQFPITTTLVCGDTLILASNRGLYSKFSDAIKPLIIFDNYHQTIKEKGGDIDFNFVPRGIKKLSDNIFIIGGMWGGLYQVDVFHNKITCLDDFNYDKLKTIDLSEL